MAGQATGWTTFVGAVLCASGAWAATAPTAARLAETAPTQGTLNAQMAALAPAQASASMDARSAPVARQVVEAAGAFHSYTRRATALSAHFENGGGVAKALAVGAGYEPTQLASGAAAYGMLAALQDFAFVSAVRDAAPSPAARAELVQRLKSDPSTVMEIAGADEASLRVAQLLGRRGADLAASGEAVRKAAYSVQKEAWSKGAIEHAPERLQAVKAMSASPSALAASDQDELMTGLVALRASPAYRAEPGARPTPVVARALAAAAITALGEGGEEHGEEMMRILSDARGLDCLKMAKLNLYQCLAVAGPHYEDMFCLGRHAMADTGQCLTAAAGWTGPLEAAPVLTHAVLPAPAPNARQVAVPIAVAALDGPERADAFTAADPPPPVARVAGDPAVEPLLAAQTPPPGPPPAPTRAELAAATAGPDPAAPTSEADEAAAMQVARADVPRFDDVPRVAPEARREPVDSPRAYADEPPPAPRAYARVRAVDPDGYAASERRGYADAEPQYDGGYGAAPSPRRAARGDDGWNARDDEGYAPAPRWRDYPNIAYGPDAPGADYDRGYGDGYPGGGR